MIDYKILQELNRLYLESIKIGFRYKTVLFVDNEFNSTTFSAMMSIRHRQSYSYIINVACESKNISMKDSPHIQIEDPEFQDMISMDLDTVDETYLKLMYGNKFNLNFHPNFDKDNFLSALQSSKVIEVF